MADNFWSKAYTGDGPDSRWPWLAYVLPTGYGQVSFNGKNVRAHRAAWMLTHGQIPSGLVVCHTCDNRLCVNPAQA